MSAILKSEGKVLLRIPKVFGDQGFWFSSLSDPEDEVEMTEYPDAQTGKVLQKVAYTRTNPVTISTPFLPTLVDLVRFLDGLKKNKENAASYEFELTERIGSTISRVFTGCMYNSHTLPGTDMQSNDARMLSVMFDYDEATI